MSKIIILAFCLVLVIPVGKAVPGMDKKSPTAEEVLTSYGIELDTPGLVAGLSNKNPMVRENAAILLGRRKEKSAIPRLKDLLEDQYIYAKLAAAGALLQMGNSSGDSVLVDALNSKDYSAALYAASIFVANGDSRAFDAVVQIAQAAEQPMDRVGAIRMLTSMTRLKGKEDTVVAVLLRTLGDSDTDVRRASAGELRKFRKADVVQAFKKALADPDDVVRGLAEQYLRDNNANEKP